jgi:DNA transposition AAA+ family ATPase
LTGPIPRPQPTYGQVAREYGEQESRVGDPTTLIVIDEADRLRMASLEQVRAIFDAQEIGLILIGMPGLEKRLARYAKLGWTRVDGPTVFMQPSMVRPSPARPNWLP